jgi:hypothetical protein
MSETRKIAAILVADVIGNSRLAGRQGPLVLPLPTFAGHCRSASSSDRGVPRPQAVSRRTRPRRRSAAPNSRPPARTEFGPIPNAANAFVFFDAPDARSRSNVATTIFGLWKLSFARTHKYIPGIQHGKVFLSTYAPQ